jgi:AcrR family transcriptional regulator
MTRDQAGGALAETGGERAGDNPAKRSNRAERTRTAIVAAALSVFNERGYHNTRITDITDAAAVAVGTFYTYFATKEDVFEVVLESVEAEVLESQQRPRGLPPIESIRETNRLYVEAFMRNARFWAMLEEAAMSNHLARQVIISRQEQSRVRTERALRRWIAAGLIPEVADIPFTAQALGAVTERCAYLWFVFGKGTDVDRATERLTMMWLRMLCIDESAITDRNSAVGSG